MERMTERLPNNNNKNQKDEPANESPLKKVLHTLKQLAKLQSNKKRLIATSLSRISNLIQMNSNSKESQDKDDVNAPMVIDLCDDDDEKTKTSSSSQQQQHLRKHMEDCKAGVVVNPLGKRDALEGIEPEPKKPKLNENSTTNTIESAFQWDGTFHKSTPEPVNLSNEESMDVSTTNEVLKTDADSIKGQQVGDEATIDITTGSAQEAHCNPFIAENSDADEGSTENEHSSKNVEDPPKKSVCETAMVLPSESLERNDDGQGLSGETCERGSDSFAGNSNRDSESSENDNLSKIVLPSIALGTIEKDDDHHQCLPEEESSERPPELVANDSKQDQEGADENSQVQHEDVVTLLLGEEQQDCFQQEGHVTLDHTATDETKAIPDEKPLVEVSARQAIALGLPLILLAGLFSHVGLVDLSGSILEGYFRAFLQLHLLGCMLSPIFKYGSKRPIFVSVYALFMIILASYEASSRTKYIHDQQFYIIVRSLLFSVGWVAIWAFGVVLKPRPFWNPRYFLPIVGMLLGNSINGISIALDTITTGLVEKHAEIDLYLTFGATQFEAVAGIVSYAIQKGAMPCINMMCVVGIVSIPGMMTGQILGGSRPMVAARYQAMIIFLIASSTLSTIVTSSYLTIVSVFSEQTLHPDRLGKNRTRSLARLILHVWGCLFGDTSSKTLALSNPSARALSSEMGPVCDASSTPFARFEVLEISPANTHRQDDGLLMAGENLGKFFLDENKDAPPTEQEDASLALEEKSPVLFHNLDMALFNGEMRAIVGPSGSGKSQLLKSLAGLNPLECGTLRLEGGEWGKDLDVLEWRKKVRYVTQHKVQIPGTPRQFVHTILSFRSRRLEGWNFMDFILLVARYIQRWGISDPMTALDKEWSVLSGGESQRILLAIAMASNPSVLLLDESTSALDHEAKLAVEASVREFVEDRHVGALWVSHDEAQTQRMMMI